MTAPVVLITMIFGWYALYRHFLLCLTGIPCLQDLSCFDERNRVGCAREQIDKRELLWGGRCLVLHHQRIRRRTSSAALRARLFLDIVMTIETLTSSY